MLLWKHLIRLRHPHLRLSFLAHPWLCVTDWWSRLSLRTRKVLIGVVVVLLALIGFMVGYALETD